MYNIIIFYPGEWVILCDFCFAILPELKLMMGTYGNVYTNLEVKDVAWFSVFYGYSLNPSHWHLDEEVSVFVKIPLQKVSCDMMWCRIICQNKTGNHYSLRVMWDQHRPAMNVGIQVGALSNNCGYDTGYDSRDRIYVAIEKHHFQ